MNTICLESIGGNTGDQTRKSGFQRALTALSLLTLLLASPAYATDAGTTMYEENFESGTLSSLQIFGNKTATVVRLSDCNRVGFFRLNRDSDVKSYSYGAPRVNLKASDKAYRLQFRLNFPDMKSNQAEETIFTLTQKNVADDGGQGPIALCINNGQFVFKVAGKTVWCAPYCERRWYDFAIDCILETPPRHSAAHGYVNLTVDGCTVSRTNGATVAIAGPHHTVFGISRPSWSVPIAQRTGSPNRQVYFDDLKIILKQ